MLVENHSTTLMDLQPQQTGHLTSSIPLTTNSQSSPASSLSNSTTPAPVLPPIVICPSEIDTISITLEKNQQCACKDCGKLFNSVWYLKQHAVKHSNDRPFKCKFCMKTYKFRSNLYQHKCPERSKAMGNSEKRGYLRSANGIHNSKGMREINDSIISQNGDSSTNSSIQNNNMLSGISPIYDLNGQQVPSYGGMVDMSGIPQNTASNNNNMIHDNNNMYSQQMNSNLYNSYSDFCNNTSASTNSLNINGSSHHGSVTYPGNESYYYNNSNNNQLPLNSNNNGMSMPLNYGNISQGHYLTMNGTYQNIHHSNVYSGYPNQTTQLPYENYGVLCDMNASTNSTVFSYSTDGNQMNNRKRKNDDCNDNLDQNYVNNYLIRHKEELHICEKCDIQFPSKEYFNRHMAQHEDDAALQYPCDLCPQKFENEKQLLHHSELHSDGTVFKCDTCQSPFRSNYALRRHKDQCRQCYRPPFGIQPNVIESCHVPVNQYSFVCSEDESNKIVGRNTIPQINKSNVLITPSYNLNSQIDSGLGSEGTDNSLNSSPMLNNQPLEEDIIITNDKPNNKFKNTLNEVDEPKNITEKEEDDRDSGFRSRINSAANSCSPSSSTTSNGFSPISKNNGNMPHNGIYSSNSSNNAYSPLGNMGQSSGNNMLNIGHQNNYQSPVYTNVNGSYHINNQWNMKFESNVENFNYMELLNDDEEENFQISLTENGASTNIKSKFILPKIGKKVKSIKDSIKFESDLSKKYPIVNINTLSCDQDKLKIIHSTSISKLFVPFIAHILLSHLFDNHIKVENIENKSSLVMDLYKLAYYNF
uniref:C2H2-type domain-containing protein n=1 Tax=Parastrongyloides trichosuri TaxID=131310 RepID=A0A0N4ZS22_PARTI